MKRVAKIFSMVLHPFFVPIYVVALMLFLNTIYLYYPMRLKVYLIWVVALYSTVLPMLTVALLKRLQRLRGREVPQRYRMALVMVVSTICYLLCAMTMMKAPSLVMFRKIAVAAALCNLFCLGASYFTRVSTHLTAMGAAVALFVVLNIAGEQAMFWVLIATLLVAGVLASARLYMGRHRSLQLLVGFVGGFAMGVISLLWI